MSNQPLARAAAANLKESLAAYYLREGEVVGYEIARACLVESAAVIAAAHTVEDAARVLYGAGDGIVGRGVSAAGSLALIMDDVGRLQQPALKHPVKEPTARLDDDMRLVFSNVTLAGQAVILADAQTALARAKAADHAPWRKFIDRMAPAPWVGWTLFGMLMGLILR